MPLQRLSGGTPLDTLQSMMNAVLLETGRALRAASKEGKGHPSSDNRFQSTIPDVVEHFQQALDDLEIDIVRAKAVLMRDLEELRSKRLAKDNPPVQELDLHPSAEDLPQETNGLESEKHLPLPVEETRVAPEAPMIAKDPDADIAPMPDDDKITITSDVSKDITGQSVPTIEPNSTAPNTSDTPDLNTTAISDPTIDSLFDMPDDMETIEAGNGQVSNDDLNFDSMDFLDDSDNRNNSEMQNTEFDLSTFGNTQDFTMEDLQDSNETSNTNNILDTLDDDLFGLGDAGAGDMDLNASMRNGEENSFADMYYTGDDGTAELDDFFK